MLIRLCLLALFVVGSQTTTANQLSKKVWKVCPENSQLADCDFVGDDAIQAAVDQAKDGDTIRLNAGVFTPRNSRDLPFVDADYGQLSIRGYVLIDGKSLTIVGQPGTVLDSEKGIAATAFVVRNAKVNFSQLEMRQFHWHEQEDNTYDGHGIFAIDSQITINQVKMSHVTKMGVTGRGSSEIKISQLTVVDSHIPIWAEENSRIWINGCSFDNNDSAGIAAYKHSQVYVESCQFTRHLDDGVYAANQAQIKITNSSIVDNTPYGLRAADAATIWIDHSYVGNNRNDISPSTETASVVVGENMLTNPPKL